MYLTSGAGRVPRSPLQPPSARKRVVGHSEFAGSGSVSNKIKLTVSFRYGRYTARTHSYRMQRSKQNGSEVPRDADERRFSTTRKKAS